MPCGRAQCNVNLNEPVVGSVLIFAKGPTQVVHIQKITYSPTEFTSGTVLSFIDSLTSVSIGTVQVLPLAIGLSTQFVLDFGDAGTPLSVGASLVLAVPAGGVTGQLEILAYQIPLYVGVLYVAPQTAGFTA